MKTKEIKVVSNVPMPENRGKYPFKEMKVGDSFFFNGLQARAAATASNAAKRYGFKFATRKEEKGARIWRTA